ncbi:hypothetical protein BH18VER2_BH18VER2_16570 [soil metagenome]
MCRRLLPKTLRPQHDQSRRFDLDRDLAGLGRLLVLFGPEIIVEMQRRFFPVNSERRKARDGKGNSAFLSPRKRVARSSSRMSRSASRARTRSNRPSQVFGIGREIQDGANRANVHGLGEQLAVGQNLPVQLHLPFPRAVGREKLRNRATCSCISSSLESSLLGRSGVFAILAGILGAASER